MGGDPEPSKSDKDNAYYRGIPGIVISRKGIYSYGPEQRESTANPKGYPASMVPPAFPTAKLVKAASETSLPWKVPNQWPEGTGAAAEMIFKENAGGEKAEESDVIVVEWASDGVEYGEKLEDKEA